MDTMTTEQRRRCMQAIHSRDTKPEMLVRKYLFNQGFRYRLNSPKLPGHPDLVLRKYRTVIFINGCFWHGHEGCKYYVIPKTNVDFWTSKIRRNQERDRAEHEALTELGWRCIIVWECQLRPKARERTLAALVLVLRNLLNDSRVVSLEIPSADIGSLVVAPASTASGQAQPSEADSQRIRPYEIPDQPVSRAAEPEGEYGSEPEA